MCENGGAAVAPCLDRSYADAMANVDERAGMLLIYYLTLGVFHQLPDTSV